VAGEERHHDVEVLGWAVSFTDAGLGDDVPGRIDDFIADRAVAAGQRQEAEVGMRGVELGGQETGGWILAIEGREDEDREVRSQDFAGGRDDGGRESS
jgi:hypothetical protein